jgi:hypothetical protein
LGENNALFANILHINGLAKAFFGNDSEALDIFKKSIYIKKELQDF